MIRHAGMFVIGWHPGRKAYLARMIDGTGMISQLTGTVALTDRATSSRRRLHAAGRV